MSPDPVAPDLQQPHLRIQAVNIFVRDQERALRFYVDQLGFHLAFDARLQSGQRWVAVSPPDGSAVLALIQPDPDSDDYQRIGHPTQVVFVTEDVVAKYREWRARGVRFRHTPRLRRVKFERQASGDVPPPSPDQSSIWGGVFTRFEDLDHNSFELVGLDEVSREIEAQRRAQVEKFEAERRAAQEREIARQVQARLFPQVLPPIQTLEYAGICSQAREVGGDYYDFLDLGCERLGLVIGDISGKGMAAALLMANLQGNLRSQCAIALDEPQRFLRSVNQLFYENTSESSYTTLFFAEYNGQSKRLRYTNCGHLSALLLRSDGALERLASTCTVLGLFKDWDCSIGECSLSPGDTLALYTDGMTESFSPDGEEFGEARLIDALHRHRGQPLPGLLASMLEEVQRFSPQEQHDDLTLIVARCKDSADTTQGRLELGQ